MRTINIGGNFSVPSDASAVVLNVTATNPTSAGYLTVFPTGQSTPTASNINYTAGEAVPNLVEVGLSSLGQASIYSSAPTNVVVDLEGYVASVAGSGSGGGLYNPLSSPTRICDTRPNNPSGLSGSAAQCNGDSLGGNSVLTVQATGVGGIPSSGVSAVVLNVTAVGPSSAGYLTVYPAGASRPTASNVNYVAGQVVPNRVVVPVSSSGQIAIYSLAPTNVLVDASGWYSASGGSGQQFQAESAPVRICDTRPGNPSGLSGGAAQCNGNTLSGGGALSVDVAGLANVPSNATAVVLNVTAVGPSQPTYLTVYPSGFRPVVSDLNPSAGETEANLVVARLSPNGTIAIYNADGTVNVVVDVLGFYP